MPAAPDIDHVTVVRHEAERFSSLARQVPHDARIPHLPRWCAHDVIAHLAGDHRWALGIVTSRTMPRSGLRKASQRGDALCDHFDRVTDQLVAALDGAAADPDAACPNFAEGSAGTLGWWPRHQSHEITLHRWDLEAATGAHAPLDPALAADGVDELLHVYTRRYGGQVLDRPIVLGCTDRPAAWRIAPGGEVGRVVIERIDDDQRGVFDLATDAATLLLVLWHRVRLDQAEVAFGPDGAAARAFVRGPLTA